MDEIRADLAKKAYSDDMMREIEALKRSINEALDKKQDKSQGSKDTAALTDSINQI